MKEVYVIVYNACGNGNDGFDIVEVHTDKSKAEERQIKLNNIHRIRMEADIWLEYAHHEIYTVPMRR